MIVEVHQHISSKSLMPYSQKEWPDSYMYYNGVVFLLLEGKQFTREREADNMWRKNNAYESGEVQQ